MRSRKAKGGSPAFPVGPISGFPKGRRSAWSALHNANDGGSRGWIHHPGAYPAPPGPSSAPEPLAYLPRSEALPLQSQWLKGLNFRVIALSESFTRARARAPRDVSSRARPHTSARNVS